MIAESMLHSRTHEVGVILLGTPGTKHHLANDGEEGTAGKLKHVTELSEVMRPSARLLKQLGKVANDGGYFPLLQQPVKIEKTAPSASASASSSTSPSTTTTTSVEGNFVDGIMVAASAIYKKTNKKKYNRKIFMLTDAENQVTVSEQTGQVLENMLAMDCYKARPGK